MLVSSRSCALLVVKMKSWLHCAVVVCGILATVACNRDDCGSDGDSWCEENIVMTCDAPLSTSLGASPEKSVYENMVCGDDEICCDWENSSGWLKAGCRSLYYEECKPGYTSACINSEDNYDYLVFCGQDGETVDWIPCGAKGTAGKTCVESEEDKSAHCE